MNLDYNTQDSFFGDSDLAEDFYTYYPRSYLSAPNSYRRHLPWTQTSTERQCFSFSTLEKLIDEELTSPNNPFLETSPYRLRYTVTPKEIDIPSVREVIDELLAAKMPPWSWKVNDEEVAYKHALSAPDYKFYTFESQCILDLSYSSNIPLDKVLPFYQEIFQEAHTTKSGQAFQIKRFEPETTKLDVFCLTLPEENYAICELICALYLRIVDPNAMVYNTIPLDIETPFPLKYFILQTSYQGDLLPPKNHYNAKQYKGSQGLDLSVLKNTQLHPLTKIPFCTFCRIKGHQLFECVKGGNKKPFNGGL